MTTDHYILGGIAIGLFLVFVYAIVLTVFQEDDDDE